MVKHSSRIELSQSALKKNINFIRKKIKPNVRISSVVKANAYGHGIEKMVPMLEKCGVNHFSVATSFEAEEVLKAKGPESEIMIMGILYDSDLEWAIEHDISFYVFYYDRLEKARAVAEKLGKKARIHLEVETGANRTGLHEADFPKAISYLKKHAQHVEFEGICTHFGGAESMSNQFKVNRQHQKFKEYVKELKKRKLEPNICHIACSAAAFAYPDTQYDMVRMGVVTYGFWPSADIYYHHLQDEDKTSDNPMARVISWKTDIMDIRPVKKDEFIGYGTSYQALSDMKIAVLPLGYSNGYPRGMSNKGYVLIHGKRAPITGLINMNLFMVDITHIPEAKIGDEVVLVGRQKNNVINVSSFTNATNLVNNEMLSRLPTSIPRSVVK